MFFDAFKRDLDKLQKLQNRALRILLNENNRQHISNLHNRTKLTLLCDRRTYRLRVYAFTRVKQEEYLDVKTVNTRLRNAPLLKSFKSNSIVVDRSVYLQSAKIWKSMDIHTRNMAIGSNPTICPITTICL